MKENSFTECYCIDSENKFVGKISIFDVIQNPEMSASQIADKNCTKLLNTQSINDAIEVAKSFIGEGIPVIEADSRKLLGTISEADLFNQHSDEIHQTRKIEAS
jgi:Mg/Co/Ni transporter MgtE